MAAKLRSILDYAVEASSADMSWKAVDRYSKDYSEMQTKQNVKFYKTPDSILRNQLKVFDEVVAKKSAENPLFKKIVDSQRVFAQRAVKWDLDTNTTRRMAYDHYFGAAAKKA
jgi:TRAP-type mannitol/chloroaromatic compound transport system substrate-binding protein